MLLPNLETMMPTTVSNLMTMKVLGLGTGLGLEDVWQDL
jgi:hypothetical protein